MNCPFGHTFSRLYPLSPNTTEHARKFEDTKVPRLNVVVRLAEVYLTLCVFSVAWHLCKGGICYFIFTLGGRRQLERCRPSQSLQQSSTVRTSSFGPRSRLLERLRLDSERQMGAQLAPKRQCKGGPGDELGLTSPMAPDSSADRWGRAAQMRRYPSYPMPVRKTSGNDFSLR